MFANKGKEKVLYGRNEIRLAKWFDKKSEAELI